MMRSIPLLAGLALALAGGTAALAAAPASPTPQVPIALRLFFVAVDRNADGKIDQGEADQFVDRLFAQADTNGDGVLTLAEVLGLQAKLAPGDGNARAATAQFQRMDLNHDGKIDGREANKAAVKHFAFLDANHDGVITLADLAGRDLATPFQAAANNP